MLAFPNMRYEGTYSLLQLVVIRTIFVLNTFILKFNTILVSVTFIYGIVNKKWQTISRAGSTTEYLKISPLMNALKRLVNLKD